LIHTNTPIVQLYHPDVCQTIEQHAHESDIGVTLFPRRVGFNSAAVCYLVHCKTVYQISKVPNEVLHFYDNSHLDDLFLVRSSAAVTTYNNSDDIPDRQPPPPVSYWKQQHRSCCSAARTEMDDSNPIHGTDVCTDECDFDKYPIREFQFYIPGLEDPIVFNPMVTLIGVGLLWGVVVYTMGKFTVCNAR
jgi:hypothetical protein